MKLFQKVMFFVGCIIIVLSALGGATLLQLSPLVIFGVLAGLQVFKKKDLRVAILVLSVLMVLINIALPSYIDVIFWIASIIAFAKK